MAFISTPNWPIGVAATRPRGPEPPPPRAPDGSGARGEWAGVGSDPWRATDRRTRGPAGLPTHRYSTAGIRRREAHTTPITASPAPAAAGVGTAVMLPASVVVPLLASRTGSFNW